MRQVHRVEGTHICEKCPATFTRKQNLQKHIKSGNHWQYVYCIKSKEVLTFATKGERNAHFTHHEMPELCVPEKYVKPSENIVMPQSNQNSDKVLHEQNRTSFSSPEPLPVLQEDLVNKVLDYLTVNPANLKLLTCFPKGGSGVNKKQM